MANLPVNVVATQQQCIYTLEMSLRHKNREIAERAFQQQKSNAVIVDAQNKLERLTDTVECLNRKAVESNLLISQMREREDGLQSQIAEVRREKEEALRQVRDIKVVVLALKKELGSCCDLIKEYEKIGDILRIDEGPERAFQEIQKLQQQCGRINGLEEDIRSLSEDNRRLRSERLEYRRLIDEMPTGLRRRDRDTVVI